MERVQKIIENQLKHWDTHGIGWWAVIPQKQTELIGWNGLLYLPETDKIEVGYLLRRQFWGQGLGLSPSVCNKSSVDPS